MKEAKKVNTKHDNKAFGKRSAVLVYMIFTKVQTIVSSLFFFLERNIGYPNINTPPPPQSYPNIYYYIFFYITKCCDFVFFYTQLFFLFDKSNNLN